MQLVDWRGCFEVDNEYWSSGGGGAGEVQADQNTAAWARQCFHLLALVGKD